MGPLGSGYEYGLLTPAVLLVCAGAVVSHGHALVPRCARLLVAVWLRSGSVRLKTLTTPATTTEPYCAPSHKKHGNSAFNPTLRIEGFQNNESFLLSCYYQRTRLSLCLSSFSREWRVQKAHHQGCLSAIPRRPNRCFGNSSVPPMSFAQAGYPQQVRMSAATCRCNFPKKGFRLCANFFTMLRGFMRILPRCATDLVTVSGLWH